MSEKSVRALVAAIDPQAVAKVALDSVLEPVRQEPAEARLRALVATWKGDPVYGWDISSRAAFTQAAEQLEAVLNTLRSAVVIAGSEPSGAK